MSVGCYNCSKLKASDKKEGKGNGTLYFCSKHKKYVSGASDGCDAYEYDIMRKQTEKDEIYKNGLNYSDDNTPISVYIGIIVILVILGLIIGIFKF